MRPKEDGPNYRAVAMRALDLERAAQFLHTFSHGVQTKVSGMIGLRVKANAIVLYGESHPVLISFKQECDPVGASVLCDVVLCLLRHAVESLFGHRG